MIIKKMNENKAKIILSFEELDSRKITLSEIQKNKSKAQDFFIKLIEDSHLSDTFLDEDSTLLIEASTYNHSFIVTITKINLTDNSKLKSSVTSYKTNSNIFEFNNISNLVNAVEILSSNYLNDSSLYFYNDKYYLVFPSSATKSSNFIRTFIILSEYCNNFYKTKFANILYEYGKCIINKNALKHLYCYTLE